MPTDLYSISLFVFGLIFLLHLQQFLPKIFALLGHQHPEKRDSYILRAFTIIISARNEAQNLKENLPHILEQDYPDFEVLVVDHQSFDGTREVLNDLKSKYENLKVIHIKEHVKTGSGKKFALTLGIKTASYPNLIFTDADCKPA